MEALSIIIPVYKNAENLIRCINSIEKFLQSKDEIIIINDSGDQELLQKINELKLPQVQIINQVPSRGSYFARNIGVSMAKNEELFFLDSDTWFGNGDFNLLRQTFNYAAPRLNIVHDGSLWQLYDAYIEMNQQRHFKNYNFFPTACLRTNKTVFNRLGPFNAQLESGGDREFGFKCYKNGIKQELIPELSIYHHARSYNELKIKWQRILKGSYELENIKPGFLRALKVLGHYYWQAFRGKIPKIHTLSLSERRKIWKKLGWNYFKIIMNLAQDKSNGES